MPARKRPFLKVIKSQLARDPKKSAVLGVLVIVLVVLLVRFAVKTPSTAEAGAPAGVGISHEADADPGEGASANHTPWTPWTRTRSPRPAGSTRTLERDPFEIHWDRFETDPRSVLDEAHSGTVGPKAAPVPESAAMTAAAEYEDLLATLQLQCTIVGNTAMAVINGRMIRVGQRLGPFTVESIENERVVLRAGDQVFVLLLRRESGGSDGKTSAPPPPHEMTPVTQRR